MKQADSISTTQLIYSSPRNSRVKSQMAKQSTGEWTNLNNRHFIDDPKFSKSWAEPEALHLPWAVDKHER